MSSLFGSVSIALRSMLAQQGAISTTANNVANINTPGYVRRRAELVEGQAVLSGNHMVGTGVELQKIVSLRDRVLQLRIQDEQQNQGALQSQLSALQDIEPLFSTETDSLGESIDNFFNSISSLSANASSIPLRQTVLLNANNLAGKFHDLASTLQQRQFSLDLSMLQSVQQVNEITAEIADLNGKIADHGPNQDELGAFVDRRDLLIENLSTLIGNQVFTANDGITVTTKNGDPLVLGRNSFELSVVQQPDGAPRIICGTDDVTDSLGGGALQGQCEIRQNAIPELLAALDTLASGIAVAVNQVHIAGFDLNGNPGQHFFTCDTSSLGSAASSFSVNISGPAAIAGSSDGTAGSNGNLNNLLGIRKQAVVAGQTPTDYYATLTFRFGARVSGAKTDLEASEAISQQLENQRGAISGVSLDEEAADLIRYQRAYEAAARVLSVLDELTEISVNLGSH